MVISVFTRIISSCTRNNFCNFINICIYKNYFFMYKKYFHQTKWTWEDTYLVLNSTFCMVYTVLYLYELTDSLASGERRDLSVPVLSVYTVPVPVVSYLYSSTTVVSTQYFIYEQDLTVQKYQYTQYWPSSLFIWTVRLGLSRSVCTKIPLYVKIVGVLFLPQINVLM